MGIERTTGISLTTLALGSVRRPARRRRLRLTPQAWRRGSGGHHPVRSLPSLRFPSRSGRDRCARLRQHRLAVPARAARDRPALVRRSRLRRQRLVSRTGGLGTVDGGCTWNTTTDVKTAWKPNTDLLARYWVHVPRNAQQVRARGTVDNDAQVYCNGYLVQANLPAIRGHDFGGAIYLNVQVTYTKPTRS